MKDTERAKEAVQEVEEILKREHGVTDFEVISRVERLKLSRAEGIAMALGRSHNRVRAAGAAPR